MKELAQKKLFRALGFLMDAVITLALITSLTVAIVITVRRVNGGFTGFGTVQSGSMTASGLNIGDTVRVKAQDSYSLGDIIVFYRAPDDYENSFDAEKTRNYEIWIHEVIDIRTDGAGRQTYLTKGSSNLTDDGAYVPQDFVLGKAKKLSAGMISLIDFVCSVRGIIVLVEIPCAVSLVYFVWDLVMTLTKGKETKPKRVYDVDDGWELVRGQEAETDESQEADGWQAEKDGRTDEPSGEERTIVEDDGFEVIRDDDVPDDQE